MVGEQSPIGQPCCSGACGRLANAQQAHGVRADDEEVGQNVDHIDGLELAGETDRQAFMGELVEHVEHPILASIVGAVLDKVIGPDIITALLYYRDLNLADG
jgi:hypothetical protein